MKVRIGDLTKIRTGKLDANAASMDGQYPFFTCSKEPLRISTYSYDCECVLVAGNGDLNVKYYNGKFDAYQRTYIIENNNVEKLYLPYLYYFLETYIEELRKQAIGGVIKYIKICNLSDAVIELPSIEKQKKIVKILKSSKKCLDMRNTQMAFLDGLIKARFVEMFGDVIHNDRKWECKQFSDITTSRLGKMLDAKHQIGTCKYPYLANFNVQWFRFELGNLNEMDFNEKDREEFCLEDGDLLVCEGGEIGRCAVWHNQVKKCYFQKALHRVRCNQNIILPDYLSWWFKYNCENGGFAAIEGAKATISHLTGAKMKMLDVTVPPIELQEQFVDFIKHVDKSKVVVQKALDEAQILFDSLMQKYFG
ncbi:restriction endonuclease subunit S [Coprococcus sp. AF16-22]|nr:restriction endonuclease subunit S [Coprococcus sp. AF16-22]